MSADLLRLNPVRPAKVERQSTDIMRLMAQAAANGQQEVQYVTANRGDTLHPYVRLILESKGYTVIDIEQDTRNSGSALFGMPVGGKRYLIFVEH